MYKPQKVPLNCHFNALGQGGKVVVYEASRKNLKIEWHFFFSNTISVSAQLCFKKGLACLGMNHVIKGERRQKTQPRPQDFSLKKWVGRPTHFLREKPWDEVAENWKTTRDHYTFPGNCPPTPPRTPACYLFSVDFARLRIV